MFDNQIVQRLGDNYSTIEKVEITNTNNNCNNPLSGSNIFITFNTLEHSRGKWVRCKGNTRQKNLINSQKVEKINDSSHSMNQDLLVDHDSSLHDTSDSLDKVLNPLEVLDRKQKETEDKIKERGVFRKWPRSDIWACLNCNDSGDKWYMLDHICKKNKKEINNIF